MTLVYRYGLPRQLTGQVEVAQQIGAAHRYYNALVALERQRRGQLAAIALDAPDRVVLMDRVAEDTAGTNKQLLMADDALVKVALRLRARASP